MNATRYRAYRPEYSGNYPMQARSALMEQPVTLNGEPAKVVGRQLDFAVVRARSGASAEFAWQTVARVIEHSGGRFAT